MDHVLGRQRVERLQVVQKRLLDQVAFFEPGPADVLLQQFASHLRNRGRNLGLDRHL
jgi:hypothetical protein